MWVPRRQEKSKVLVVPHGVKMRFKAKNNDKKYFVCSKKSETNCPVSVTVDPEKDMIVASKGSHNHDINLVQEKVKKKVDAQIRQGAVNITTAPRKVLQDITNDVLNDEDTKSGLLFVPKPNTVARALNRMKKDEFDCPLLPKSKEEIVVPEYIKKTPHATFTDQYMLISLFL